MFLNLLRCIASKMVYQDVKGDASGEVTHTVEPIQMGQSSAYKRRFAGIKLAVDQEPSSFATNPNASNADFDPIPPSNRTWTWKAYVAYWMADAWAVSNWVTQKCSRFND